jgi:hypothetical protein
MTVGRPTLPPSRRVHVKLSNGDEAVVEFWEESGDALTQGARELLIPPSLTNDAVWLYDLERRKILKNTTGRNLLVPLGVPDVPRAWLVEKGFI